MFDWKIKETKATNAIFLEDGNGQEGRPFKARFLQAGLVKYDFGVCLLKKETIDSFINTFIGCPVIINHKDNLTQADKVGEIKDIWFSEEDGWFWCDGIITDEEAVELIENGYNISCQYAITKFEENKEGKKHNAIPYDKEILDGVFEHLAIVENPRYEDAFIAVNAYIASNNEFKEEDHPRDEDGKFSSGSNPTGTENIKEWGESYPQYSGKPKEAIDFLLKTKKGHVPAAISKDGIGDIDFVYGTTGAKGFGLAHIIEQRKKQGIDGEELIRNLPDIIQNGDVITKEKHTDRKYIISQNREVAIRLDFNGNKRNWIVSAYITKELQGSNSLDSWHTMLALDSNLHVANGYVSITTPAIDIIPPNTSNLNPNVTNHEATDQSSLTNFIKEHNMSKFLDELFNGRKKGTMNKKEEVKALMFECLKELKAANEADDDKKKDDDKAANEDKRKLIDEIGGILKGKVDEELWRTIIGKAEKLAYEKSEAGTADNDDDDEEKKKDETKNKAKNKCKNEDKEEKEDKQEEYEEFKEKVREEAENKAKNSMNEAIKKFFEADSYKQKIYMSQKEGIELGRQLY